MRRSLIVFDSKLHIILALCREEGEDEGRRRGGDVPKFSMAEVDRRGRRRR